MVPFGSYLGLSDLLGSTLSDNALPLSMQLFKLSLREVLELSAYDSWSTDALFKLCACTVFPPGTVSLPDALFVSAEFKAVIGVMPDHLIG